MAAAEITLCAQCDLSGAILIFLLPVLLQAIVVIKLVHVIVLLIIDEVFM